ncbi:formylglycine-generating enzyme family protein [Micromonospora sp. NPDC005174]|uniref:formylglycine-generating enzyme family protein n=1 Tax=Micromonospora sp. NPDC005174 TaxID=3157018 RepID=UPI0033A55FF2
MKNWRTLLNDISAAAASSDADTLSAAITELPLAVANAAEVDRDELMAVAAMHELPWVRVALLRGLVARWPDGSDVREVVGWLTHDFEDFVAFEAIDLAGRMGLKDVLADLLLIVGKASERIAHRAGKPVGIGHALVLRTVTAIVGSDSPAAVAAVEKELFTAGVDEDEYPPVPPRDSTASGVHTHDGMRLVSGGQVQAGPPPSFDTTELIFDWNDPSEPASCDDFWLDVLPVSNAEYDAFSRTENAHRHKFCHPAEPKEKIHLRNTMLDRRSQPDHPVTGVDWFDAYAYARSKGQRLPNETEWQRAAQGDDQRAYPWGERFDPLLAHCLPGDYPRDWQGVQAWRRSLLTLIDQPPAVTTRRRGIPGSESPFGISDLSGGVWEWTSSAFAGSPFSPTDSDRDAIDIIYDQRSYAVIKGGTWTSLPEQASVAFRGRDLAYDRHFEIGFRCACDCAQAAR